MYIILYIMYFILNRHMIYDILYIIFFMLKELDFHFVLL